MKVWVLVSDLKEAMVLCGRRAADFITGGENQ